MEQILSYRPTRLRLARITSALNESLDLATPVTDNEVILYLVNRWKWEQRDALYFLHVTETDEVVSWIIESDFERTRVAENE